MSPRIIALFDMDYFFAQIEERENPRFVGKPIVVGADPQGGRGRGVVSTANYVARTYGIHSAMPISQAYALCKEAIFLPPQMELYGKVSDGIITAIRSFGFPVEQVSLDEAYVDLSAFAQLGLREEAEALVRAIQQQIFVQERLTVSCGVGPNKMVAKMACEQAKPNGILVVFQDQVQEFLDPLPIRTIPGIGKKTEERIERFFAAQPITIKRLREALKKDLVTLLGVVGEELYEKARGEEHSQVVALHEVKSIGREHTFATDTRDPETLISVFQELVSEVTATLEQETLSCKTITVVARFTGFETHTKSKTLPACARDATLLKKEAIKLLLRFVTENTKPLRLIGVRVSRLS